MYVGRNSSLLRMVTRKAERFRVDVVATEPFRQWRPCKITGFLACSLPELSVKRGPRLSCKVSVQSRRQVSADERRFDGNRTSSAKRIRQHASRPPKTQLYHRRSECLAQLSFA